MQRTVAQRRQQRRRRRIAEGEQIQADVAVQDDARRGSVHASWRSACIKETSSHANGAADSAALSTRVLLGIAFVTVELLPSLRPTH
ncbi:hypothetical protein [Lysobacter gummosus]|uniref:hypothetical protein n=1 Tax=Lysobacter gummosus TaxID=262324 RepID=UPI003633574B